MEVTVLTKMTRRTVSLPPNMEKEIFDLRKTDAFCRCSYSEIVRRLIELGLDIVRK